MGFARHSEVGVVIIPTGTGEQVALYVAFGDEQEFLLDFSTHKRKGWLSPNTLLDAALSLQMRVTLWSQISSSMTTLDVN